MEGLPITKMDTRYRPISAFAELFWKKEFYNLKEYIYIYESRYRLFFLIITPKGNSATFGKLETGLSVGLYIDGTRVLIH